MLLIGTGHLRCPSGPSVRRCKETVATAFGGEIGLREAAHVPGGVELPFGAGDVELPFGADDWQVQV